LLIHSDRSAGSQARLVCLSMSRAPKRGLAAIFALLAGLWLVVGLQAAPADPPWYQGEAPASWHYRVPLTLPGGAAQHSMVHVDVDFNALFSALSIDPAAVSLDLNSPRVVGPANQLVPQQEFSPHRFNGVLDSTGNGRGEIRFIAAEAPAAGTYYLYFDITAHGSKPMNPADPVNANFEHSDGPVPTSWVRSAVNTGGGENNEVHYTGPGSSVTLRRSTCGEGLGFQSVDTGPNTQSGQATGLAWYLLGFRDRCEDGPIGQNELVQLSRSITVPAGTAAGELQFHFAVQGWDGVDNASQYSWFALLVDGQPVDQTSLGISNTGPAANRLIITPTQIGPNGYGTYRDYGWRQATLDLSAYAGTTIEVRFQTRHHIDNQYRLWVKLNDVRWSEQQASLGDPEGYGLALLVPEDTDAGRIIVPGQQLAIRVQLDAEAQSVFADLLDPDGNVVVSGISLFDQGAQGDEPAGDLIWSNDGSNPDYPTYEFGVGDAVGDGWRLILYAPDASSSSIGFDGFVRHPGHFPPGQGPPPLMPENYFNIAGMTLHYAPSVLSVDKVLIAVWEAGGDEVGKAVPGAWLDYRVRVANVGAAPASALQIDELMDSQLALCVAPPCLETSAAVGFADGPGGDPSGLVFDPAAALSYSVDGSDFSYVPVPDAEGFDPAVRHIRIAPAGEMAEPAAGSEPAFDLLYRVRVE
jgi:hypothetical protein